MVTTRSKKTQKKPTSISSVGETLVSEQEKRFKVRQQRDAIAHKVGTFSGFDVIASEKVAPASVEIVSPSGAQSSPELASLAASYINHEDPNVRSLAGAVLRLVRE